MEEAIERTTNIQSTIRSKANELEALIFDPSENSHLARFLRSPRNDEESDDMMLALDSAIDSLKTKVESARRLATSSGRERMLQAAMFSHLGEGMIVVGEDRGIVVMNESARKLLNCCQDDKHAGFSYSEKFILQDRNGAPVPNEKNPIELAFASEKPVRIAIMDDVYCVRDGDAPFPVSISASPIVLNGAVEGVVAIFEDITKEKKIDEIKSDFIYIASHQLRTPLTVSTLHTEMLLGGHAGEITKDQRELLSEIHFYNKKMAQLLSVFMTVSKIEMGTFTMQQKPTDLRSVMDDVLHELSTQIKNKKLVVAMDYAETLPDVHTDPEFVRIVFQNLVSNAVKYTPHDGKIFLAIQRSGKEVSVVIEDTGCGIPKEEQSQVFVKLYRGTNTKSHRWDSNGLGLYITKSIIDKFDGKISFRSEEGKGTTFYVNLPIGQKSQAGSTSQLMA